MTERGSTTGKRAAGIAAAMLVLLALGTGLSRVELDTDPATFLPAGDPAAAAATEKAKSFGGDPVIVILESKKPRRLLQGEQLTRLIALEAKLGRSDDVAAVYGPGTVLNQLAGATQDVMARLSGTRDGLRNEAVLQAREAGYSEKRAREVGRRAVAAFDERYGSLLVQAMPVGLPTLRNQRFIDTVMYGDGPRARPEWQFVVPGNNAVALIVRPREDLDEKATTQLVDRVRAAVQDSGLDVDRTTVTGAPAITAGLADRARGELPLLGAVAILLVGLVYLLLPWTRRRSRLRPLFAALVGTAGTLAVFGLLGRPLTLGVVAFLPILLGIGSDFPLYLSRAGRHREVIVAVVAAAAGFASLALSPLPFVRELGLALALGTLLAAATALALRRVLGPVAPTADPTGLLADAGRRRLSRRARGGLAICAVSAAVAGWLLLPGLPVQTQPEELAQGLEEVEDARHAEQVLGSSGEVTVMVSADDVADPEVLSWLGGVEDTIVRTVGDRVHPVVSTSRLFRFLGPDPTPAQVEAALDLMPQYLTSAVLRSDRKQAVLVLGAEFGDIEELDGLLSEVDVAIGEPPAGVDVEVIGLPVAADRGLDLVTEGRVWINVAGILAAALVLLVGLRSGRDALRATLTVLLATGWLAAIVWASTGSLSPLTVAIGSLVTATGVEFAVMMSRGGPGGAAFVRVVTVALAGTTGYLVLGLSELAVLREFGLLLACGVTCSFFAATVMVGVLPPRVAPTPGREDDRMETDDVLTAENDVEEAVMLR